MVTQAPIKTVERHYSYLLGLMRTIFPFHCYGKSTATRPLVQDRLASLVEKFKQEHPEASELDLRRRNIAFLCQARKELFDELPQEEQDRWRRVARRDDEGDEHDK